MALLMPRKDNACCAAPGCRSFSALDSVDWSQFLAAKWLWINTYENTIFRGMNIHFNPAILMWTTGVLLVLTHCHLELFNLKWNCECPGKDDEAEPRFFFKPDIDDKWWSKLGIWARERTWYDMGIWASIKMEQWWDGLWICWAWKNLGDPSGFQQTWEQWSRKTWRTIMTVCANGQWIVVSWVLVMLGSPPSQTARTAWRHTLDHTPILGYGHQSTNIQ